MADLFKLRIITPDRVFYEGEAEMVEFNTTEGEIGIYKKHIPMTVIIKPGILTITEESETKTAAFSMKVTDTNMRLSNIEDFLFRLEGYIRNQKK